MDPQVKMVQRIIGWIAVLALLALAFLSMSPDYTLTGPVIAGVLVAIAMLLGKVEALAELVEAWRK